MPDLILEYTNLLHTHQNLDAPAIRAFVDQHADADPDFARRVQTLNALFTLKTAFTPRFVDLSPEVDVKLAAAGIGKDTVKLGNVGAGYKVRIFPAGFANQSSIQFDGAVPEEAQLYVGDTPVELLAPLDESGYATVLTEAVRPVLMGQAGLRMRVE